MSFLKNLDWRYATQKFNGNSLPEDRLKKIKKSIRMSPTSLNIQPYKVLILENNESNKELFLKLEAKAYNQKQISTCSHLFVFCGLSNLDKRIEELIELNIKETGHSEDTFEGYKNTMYKKANGMNEEQTKDWVHNQIHVVLGFALAACTELKIDSCPIGGFDPNSFKEILKLEEDLNPVILLTVGERDLEDDSMPKSRFDSDKLFL